MGATLVDEARLREALLRTGCFEKSELRGFKAQRLQSLTNLTFRLEIGSDAFCVRLPGAGTEDFIDRDLETKIVAAVSGLGIGPPVVHIDRTGTMVTRFIPNAVPLTKDLFRLRPGAFEEATSLLKKVHDSNLALPGEFNVFRLVESYVNTIGKRGVTLPPMCRELLEELPAIERALNGSAPVLVPCHCDPICENFIHDGAKMWLVDWEYAGMNDAMWDLSDLMVESETLPAEDDSILLAYFGRRASEQELARIVVYKPLVDLLWGLWGFMRQGDSFGDIDYEAYGKSRIERCISAIVNSDFRRAVVAVDQQSVACSSCK